MEGEAGEREIEAIEVEDAHNSDDLHQLLGLQAQGVAAAERKDEGEGEGEGEGEEEWEDVDEEELDDTFDSRQLPEHPPGLVQPYRAHSRPVLSIAVDPSNPRAFCSGSQDDTLALWTLDAPAPLFRRRFGETVSLVRYSFDGELLFAATLDGSVQVIDCRAADWPTRHVLGDLEGEVTSLATHPKGPFVLAGTDEGEVQLWNGATAAPACSLRGHRDGVNQVEFTPDGRFALSCGDDGTLRRWQISSAQCRTQVAGPRFHQAEVLSFACHAQRAVAVSTAADGSFAVSNYEKGEVYHCSAPRGSEALCCALASPLEAFAVGDAAGTLLMVDLQKQVQLAAHKAARAVVGVQFWPQQKSFVSCTADGSVVVNGFGARREHLVLPVSRRPVHAIAVADAHTLLAACDDGAVLAIDIRRAAPTP